MEYKDGLVYKNEETGEKTIFNSKTWVTILRGIILYYTPIKNENEAKQLIDKWFVLPKTEMEVISYSHEIEYHWAMWLVYGEGYWWKKGISSEPPEDYNKWEQNYRKTHNLDKDSFEFLDG